MKIQIIALGMTDQSHRKFYNTQDMGLGRALADMGHCVDMYSFIKGDTDEIVEFAENLHMHYLHSKSFGFHSLHSCDFITSDVDGVIVFSDNQMNFKQVRKVCQKNHVVCLPYIGALGSHNTSSLKKMLLDILIPNIRYYRKMTVMAKTPNVKKQMESEQIKDVIVAPCCLDLAAVHEDYEKEDVGKLREEIGFKENQKVILFLARLIDEKHPLEMLDIFAELSKKDDSYRLISIGKGELQPEFEKKMDDLGLRDKVYRIESIENSQVWKFYRMSDVMVNLNRVEIFGMAILEAMYYGCPVVARRAPGPEYILTSGQDGFLCDNSMQISEYVEKLCNTPEYREEIVQNEHRRIMQDFTWKSTAEIMLKTMEAKQKENKSEP